MPVLADATRPVWGDTRGFPLNLDFYNLPATTNFPPLSQEAWASTAPFVSVPGDQTYRPLFLADRKVVAGVVDAITGQPLIREQDLELPVGRGTYRMIRTYGGNGDGSCGEFNKTIDGQGDRLAIGKLWDWAGTGWMISENPILLFDAQYIQHDPTLPPRCYLILDAHHSIPFTQDVATGNYIAPAWFDAIMSWHVPAGTAVGHKVDATASQPAKWVWDVPPQILKVRLYGEAVTYVFHVSYEDMAKLPATGNSPATRLDAHAAPRLTQDDGVTVHEPGADGGGLGTPYAAFLERIEDRFGNKVVIDHCPHRKYSVDPDPTCESCVHTCAEKGQIKTIRLFHAGDDQNPDWTLVYVHRSFRTWAPSLDQVPCASPPLPPDAAAGGALQVGYGANVTASKDQESKWFLQNAVHAVYVYKGSVSGLPQDDATTTASRWTLPAEAFVGEYAGPGPADFQSTYNSLDDQDTTLNGVGWTERKIAQHLGWGVPSGWTYRLRYTYDETLKPIAGCTSPGDHYRDINGLCVEDPHPQPFEPYFPIPSVTPSLYTAFGATMESVPRIFHWGTPFVLDTDIGGGPVNTRISPCLLRVEKTERLKGASGPEGKSYTGYVYATHLDKPTRLFDPSAPETLDNHATAAAFEKANVMTADDDHTYQRVVPKLKHILRDDRLRAAMTANQSTSINSVFDPGLPPSDTNPDPVRPNRLCYAQQANLTLDWSPIGRAPPGYAGAGGPGGPWVVGDLVGHCVLTQVARNRLFVRDATTALVGRVKLNDGAASDGIYDLVYLGVRPISDSGSPFPQDWSQFDGLPGLSSQGLSYPNDLPDAYTFFPFSWKRLARNSWADWRYSIGSSSGGLLPSSPLDQPVFMTLVDRHDGACFGEGKVQERAPYMARFLYCGDEDGIKRHDKDGLHQDIMLPQQRQLVGINAAGFLLFERGWDYQTQGVTAVGPTEQFVYEETHKHTDSSDASSPEILSGLRLTEHRSLGWGVGYVYDVQHGQVSGGGCIPVCTGSCVHQQRGLITLYDYFDYDDTTQTPAPHIQTNLVSRIRIKEGLAGTPKRLQETDFDLNEQATQQRRYRLDESGDEHLTMTSNRYVQYYPPDASDPEAPKKVNWESVWQSAARPWPGAPSELTPFESTFYNDKGLMIGRAYGLCTSMASNGVAQASGGDGSTIFVDVDGYNEQGQKIVEIVDADIQDSQGSGGAAAAAHRTAWDLLHTEGDTPQPRLPTAAQLDTFVSATAEYAHRVVPQSIAHLIPPLNRATAYGYSADNNLEILAKPGDRFDFYVARPVGVPDAGPEDRYSQFILSTVYFDVALSGTAASPTGTARKAGQIATVRDGRLMRSWNVQWPTGSSSLAISGGIPAFGDPNSLAMPLAMFTSSASLDPPQITGGGSFTALAAVRMQYDELGRPSGAKAVGLPVTAADRTEELERVATYTDFGLVAKRIEPSQTLHRTVTNPLGQLIAEFKGTGDNSDCWQDGGQGNVPNNMVLTARHFYGDGINNIRQPVLTRHYRNALYCADTDYHGHGNSAFASDRTGWEDAYGYDRRGRRCVVEMYGTPTHEQLVGDPRPQPDQTQPTGSMYGEADWNSANPSRLLRAEYTWYDHQDRVRFNATFAPADAEALRGQGDDNAVNPRARNVYAKGDPTAADILAFNPLRLTENVYNDRGELEEVLEYDVKDSSRQGTLAHTSTRMYYDHKGRVINRLTAGGRWERMTYDAIGRLVSTSVLRGEMIEVPGENAYEIERTDNVYHENGQVERSSHVVRVVPAEDPSSIATLIAGPQGNAVRSDTLTWFDDDARPIAMASLGTGSPGSSDAPNGTFSNQSADPPPRPSDPGNTIYQTPPEWDGATHQWNGHGLPDYAQISTTSYDDAGRERTARAPDGVLTVKEYDGLGRVVLEKTFPADADPSTDIQRAQVVAYEYRDGKLVKIAAPRPGHLSSSNSRPRFTNNTDPSIQITELVYGNAPYTDRYGFHHDELSADVLDESGSPVSKDYDLLYGIRFPAGGCRCDVNNSGDITVQDIFDFLNLWFANNDPRADFNGDGQVSVQDIFDFLSCWFSPPPDCRRVWNTALNGGVDIKFDYTIDGQIHSRSDLTRVSGSPNLVRRQIAFSYDHLGRRVGIDVTSGGVEIADSVERTRYFYDPLDRLLKATAEARDHALDCFYPVATSVFDHDSFGDLASELLLHGPERRELVDPLRYNWQYLITASGSSSTNGAGPVIVPRLQSMVNPWGSGYDGSARADGSHRASVGFSYAPPDPQGYSAPWLDSAMHRVRSLAWNATSDGSGTSIAIARYAYAGAALRAALVLGPGANPSTQQDAVTQSNYRPGTTTLGTSDGSLPGLDRFGRVFDLAYVGGVSGSDVLARRQLKYDDSRGGLLVAERVTQQYVGGGPPHGTTGADRSWFYGYDTFGRLASAATGTLNATWEFDSNNHRVMEQAWKLDELGNWFGTGSGNAFDPAGIRETLFDVSGNPATDILRTHKTNARNEIDSQVYQGRDHGTPATPVEVKYAYDPAGRMVYDGRVVYEYDAFGRLVQVREVLKGFSIDPSGSFTIPTDAYTGRLIAHYSYDALGRVVRTQRPTDQQAHQLTITDLYYDGVRVVQEVGWASVTGRDPGNGGYYGYLPRMAKEVSGDGLDNAGESDEDRTCEVNPPGDWRWDARRLEREYVWHSDPSAYVDECAAQLVYTDAHSWDGSSEHGDDTTPTVLYVLTDHNANVVGLADIAGTLRAQYSYTPYGECRAAEYFADGSNWSVEAIAAARSNRLGHQGLRTERFDRPWEGPLDVDAQDVEHTGPYRAVCHNRNRIYDPVEGRFTGSDPNGLGLPVLDDLAFRGHAITASDIASDIPQHYGDGMNAHVAYGTNPRGQRDAFGLFFGAYMSAMGDSNGDAFDIVDDFIAEDIGSKLAFLERVTSGAHTAAYVATYLGSWLPGPVGWASGAANVAMGMPDSIRGTWVETGMNAADAIAMLYGAGRIGARAIMAATESAARYSERFGARAIAGAAAREEGAITRTIESAGRYAEHVGKIMPYSQAQKLTAGAKHAIEAHKLLEWRHVKNGGFGALAKGDIPAVILTQAQHSAVTTRLRQLLPYGGKYSPAQIIQGYERAYRELGHPEWLDHIRQFFP
ncbi:MAG TPA: GC-type dockerin domain-anchored protein [Phycisphaerales bacterium]|nr:GC-type dockerin domain-anchored protein [Phycisphaerales bacterium]